MQERRVCRRGNVTGDILVDPRENLLANGDFEACAKDCYSSLVELMDINMKIKTINLEQMIKTNKILVTNLHH